MWENAVVTNVGKSLLSTWVAGKTLNIDKATGGTGKVLPAALMDQTALVNEKQLLSIIGSDNIPGGVRLKVQITAPPEGYTLNQIGIWGSVDGGEPTLIALYQDETDITIPSSTSIPDFLYTFFGIIEMSNSGTMTVTIDTSSVVSLDTLMSEINRIYEDMPPGYAEVANVVYVAKTGNDSNDGTAENPKLTISAAVTAAAAKINGSNPQAAVVVMDAGRYTETITLLDNIHLFAEKATIVGRINIRNNCKVNIYAHYASENNQTLLYKDGTTHAYYKAVISDGRGLSGTLTGTSNIYNITASSILFIDVELMYVANNGMGVREHSSTTGHIHFDIKDLYLGSGARGIYGQGTASNIIGKVDHVLKIGGATNTTAIQINNPDCVLKITAEEIIADTAYNIAAGELYLNCPKVSGTGTGTPAFLPASKQELLTHSAKNAIDAHGLIPSCKVYHNVNQSVSNNTIAILNFNTKVFDTDNMYNDLAQDRITINTPGKYLIVAQIGFAKNGTGYRQVRIAVNGTVVGDVVIPAAPAEIFTRPFAVTISDLEENDYIQVVAYQNSGGSLNVVSSAEGFEPLLSVTKIA